MGEFNTTTDINEPKVLLNKIHCTDLKFNGIKAQGKLNKRKSVIELVVKKKCGRCLVKP